MAQPSVIQEGIDRIEDARRSFEKRYKKIQKQADKRRRELEKTAEQRGRQIRDDISNNPIVKRVDGLREGASQRIEEQVEQVLSTFRIATQGEIERLERKVAQLSRKVRELERV